MTKETLTVLSAFDEALGLVPIWNSPFLSFQEETPYIVAVKSLTSIMIQETDLGEMIIPFPAQSLYGFVFYFMLVSTPISLTFVVNEEFQDLLYKKRQILSLNMHTFVQKLKQAFSSYSHSDLIKYAQKYGSNLSHELAAILFDSLHLSKDQFFPSELRAHESRLLSTDLIWLETQLEVKERPCSLKEFTDKLLNSVTYEKFMSNSEIRYLFAKCCYIRGFYDRAISPFPSFDVTRPPPEPFSIWYAASIHRKGDPATAVKILSNLSFDDDLVPEIERLGFLAYLHGGSLSNHKEAENYALQAIKLADESQNSLNIQSSLVARCGLAISYFLRGMYNRVREVTSVALEIASHAATSDRYWKSWLLNALSISEEQRGVIEDALLSLYHANQFFEQLEHNQALAITSNNLANILFSQGKYEECLSHYETAYFTLLNIGDRHNAIKTISNIARVYHRIGRYPESLRFARRAFEELQDIGDKVGVTEALINMGKAYHELGEIEKAHSTLRDAKNLACETSNRKALAQAYLEVGAMLVLQDEYLAAEGWLNGALNAFKMFEIKGTSLARCHLLLVRCSAYQDHFEEAYQHFEKAQLIAFSLNSEVLERQCRLEEELVNLLKRQHES